MRIKFLEALGANRPGDLATVRDHLAWNLVREGVAQPALDQPAAPQPVETATAPAPERAVSRDRARK